MVFIYFSKYFRLELQKKFPTINLNTVRLAVRAELVEAHSPFDRLRANELKRTVLRSISYLARSLFPEGRRQKTQQIGASFPNVDLQKILQL